MGATLIFNAVPADGQFQPGNGATWFYILDSIRLGFFFKGKFS